MLRYYMLTYYMTNVLFGAKVFLLRYYMLTYYMTNVLFGLRYSFSFWILSFWILLEFRIAL